MNKINLSPLLLFSAWIITVGFIMWGKSQKSLMPPAPDTVSYVQKAKNSWDNARKGFPQNPLNVAQPIRPPGTVFISFPFGYDGNYKAFHFRSVFIPFILWTLAILVLLWPRDGIRNPLETRRAIAAAILFGANPFFFCFESSDETGGYWGMMDQALGAVGGLAMAAVIRSMSSRSYMLLLSCALLCCFAILLKPAGSMVLLFVTAYFGLMEALTLLKRYKAGEKPMLSFPLTGLVLFAGLGGLLSILCIKSDYLGSEIIMTMKEGQNYVLKLSEAYTLLELTQRLYMYIGVPGIITIGGVVLFCISDLRYRKRIEQPTPLIFCLIVLALGLWLHITKMGFSQTRYYSPFAFMGTALLLGWLYSRLSNMDKPTVSSIYKTGGLIATSYAIAILCAMSFTHDMPFKSLQRLLATHTDISNKETDGIQMSKWLIRESNKLERNINVYPFVTFSGQKEQSPSALIRLSKNVLSTINPDTLTYYTSLNHIWKGEPTLYLSELVWDSDLIVINDDTSTGVHFEKHTTPFWSESIRIQRFILSQQATGKIKTIHRNGNLIALKILDKDKFILDFESFFANTLWSDAFKKANRMVNGRVYLFDTLSATSRMHALPQAGDSTEGSIDGINGSPAGKDSITVGRFLKLNGWLAANARKGIPADSIYITLQAPDGSFYIGPTMPMRRPDLSDGFGHPSLIHSGFETNIDLKGLKGWHMAGLACMTHGTYTRFKGKGVMLYLGRKE